MAGYFDSDCDEFVPHRLLRNGHAQTIFGSVTRVDDGPESVSSCLVKLPDGDHLLANICLPDSHDHQHPQQVAVLFHGLGGSFNSSYVRRISSKLNRLGVPVVAVDARGCGVAANYSRNHTHAARTDDMLAAIRFVADRFPSAQLCLIGFSLAGNTLLKLLGTTNMNAPAASIAALAVAPPIDLVRCTQYLRNGLSRFYDYYYAKMLMRQLNARRARNSHLVDVRFHQKVDTLLDFDTYFTAPVAGYKNAWDYYEDSSAIHELQQLKLLLK